MNVYYGIDFGTTYSSIACYDSTKGWAEAISLDHADGAQGIPSTVYFDPAGQVVVGETARRMSLRYPERVIPSIKRSLGMDFVTSPDGRTYSPQEVTAKILSILKEDAERYMGQPVAKAVIAVPAFFNEREIDGIQKACKLAGIKVLEFLPEPCSAALGFALDQSGQTTAGHILVYDMGGGSSEVALVSLEQKGRGDIVPKLDAKLLYKNKSEQVSGLTLDAALARLVFRKALDCGDLADVTIPEQDERSLWIYEDYRHQFNQLDCFSLPLWWQGRQVEITVTRAEFEHEISELMQGAETLLQQILLEVEQRYGLLTERRIQELVEAGQSRAELKTKKVQLLFCGGLTRMQLLKECVTRVMGEPPLQLRSPDLLVSLGAALRACLVELAAQETPPPERSELPRTTSSQTQPSITHVIDMFVELGLPVCDDATAIEQKIVGASPRYLRDKNSPDPAIRHRAALWFKTIEALQYRRSMLLGIVRDNFFQVADASLAAMLAFGGNQKLTRQMCNQLIHLAQEQCRCALPLAEGFVDEYLRARGLQVGSPLTSTKPLDFAGVVSLFWEIGLPVTNDDKQINYRIRELFPSFQDLAKSQEPLLKDRAEIWFRTVERLQHDRAVLIDIVRVHFFQLADVALHLRRFTFPPKPFNVFCTELERRAQEECSCADSLAHKMVGEYLRDRDIKPPRQRPSRKLAPHKTRQGQLPPHVLKLDAFRVDSCPSYQTKCIVTLFDRFDVDILRIFFEDYEDQLGSYANYFEPMSSHVRGDLASAAKRRGKLGELSFYLAQYWLDTFKGGPEILIECKLHQNLGILLRTLSDGQGSQDSIDDVVMLLNRILPQFNE